MRSGRVSPLIFSTLNDDEVTNLSEKVTELTESMGDSG